VLFASVPNLVVELKEAMSNLQISSYRRKFEKYNLVILDELGYVSFDKAGCEMLFNLLSSRNDKGSIIITTNLTFDRWEDVFKDPTLTGAMIDRLAHKAHVLDISREKGGRFEETVAWLESSKSKQTTVKKGTVDWNKWTSFELARVDQSSLDKNRNRADLQNQLYFGCLVNKTHARVLLNVRRN
jgi:hypothetical protein